MLWKHETKQLLRTPLRTLIFCLALAVVIGLLCVTLGLRLATERAVATIEDMYVTVAVIPRVVQSQYASTADYNFAKTQAKQLYDALTKGDIVLENVIDQEYHTWSLAYDLNCVTPISGDYTSDEYSFEMNKPQNLALFAVTCTEAMLAKENPTYDAEGKPSGVHREYAFVFDVHGAPIIHSDLTAPEKLALSTDKTRVNGDMLFETGHNYLVWGYYDSVGESAGKLTLSSDVTNTHAMSNGLISQGTLRDDLWESEKILYINCPKKTTPLYKLPIMGEYTGSYEVYLEADPTGMWAKLEEFLNIEYSTLRVNSANEIRSLLSFAIGKSYLIEGTSFSAEDLEQGNKVAIISDALAEANGLKVGDTLDLHFYSSSWRVTNNLTSVQAEVGTPKVTSIYGVQKADHPEAYTENDSSKPYAVNDGLYTIVGIYGGSSWQDDYRYMHPNTVIVPQNALEKASIISGQYELCYSLLIPNGAIDAVEEEMIAQGYGDRLSYYDGGYSVIMPNVKSIYDSAVFVNIIAITLWAIVVLTVLTLFVLMLLPAGRVKYRLGTGKRAIFGQMMFSTMLILVPAGVLGCLGGVMLYDRALEWVMQSDFTNFANAFTVRSENAEELEQILYMLGQEPRVFVITAIVQLAILAVLGTVMCAIASLRKTGFRQ